MPEICILLEVKNFFFAEGRKTLARRTRQKNMFYDAVPKRGRGGRREASMYPACGQTSEFLQDHRGADDTVNFIKFLIDRHFVFKVEIRSSLLQRKSLFLFRPNSRFKFYHNLTCKTLQIATYQMSNIKYLFRLLYSLIVGKFQIFRLLTVSALSMYLRITYCN